MPPHCLIFFVMFSLPHAALSLYTSLPLSQCVDVAVEDLPLQMPAILASMKDVCKTEPMYFLHYL